MRARIAAGFKTAAEAADRFGWPKPTYSSHENGTRGILPKVAQKYARAFRVPVEHLLFGIENNAPRVGDDELSEPVLESRAVAPIPKGSTLVSVYDIKASAGHGSFVTGYEEVVDRVAFPPRYLDHITKAHPSDLTIVGVKGNSMAPTLKDDDIVMIDTSKKNPYFDGLFVLLYEDVLQVKRLGRSGRKGHVMVISDNKAEFPAFEAAVEDVTIYGKVVWRGVKE